ncbi:MAG: hypothetical protein ACLUIQ_09165 [Dialister invisus]
MENSSENNGGRGAGHGAGRTTPGFAGTDGDFHLKERESGRVGNGFEYAFT